jgi:pentatricopeptide repeat protein
VTLGQLIKAFSASGDAARCVDVLELMTRRGLRPEGRMFTFVFAACATAGNTATGKRAHKLYTATNMVELIASTALISMDGTFGDITSARSEFDRMPQRDSASYSAMLAAYASVGAADDAIKLF